MQHLFSFNDANKLLDFLFFFWENNWYWSWTSFYSNQMPTYLSTDSIWRLEHVLCAYVSLVFWAFRVSLRLINDVCSIVKNLAGFLCDFIRVCNRVYDCTIRVWWELLFDNNERYFHKLRRGQGLKLNLEAPP